MTDNLITELERWYRGNCDGDWEHDHGITISTLDNPGWLLSIDLRDTRLASKPFDEVTMEASDENWYQCRIKDGAFDGAGGAQNLGEMLRTFLDWANASAS